MYRGVGSTGTVTLELRIGLRLDGIKDFKRISDETSSNVPSANTACVATVALLPSDKRFWERCIDATTESPTKTGDQEAPV